jgi:hypothetical protein
MEYYNRLKKWVEAHKQQLVLVAAGIALFFVGYGTGTGITRKRFEQQYRGISPKYNTTKATSSPTTQLPDTLIKAATSTAPEDANCPVKGNISSKDKKIYHISGGRYYAQTKAEQCFNTEAEAVAAGFKKSGL